MGWLRQMLGMEHRKKSEAPAPSPSPPENGARYRIKPAHGKFGGDNIRWCVELFDDGEWRMMSWHASYADCERDVQLLVSKPVEYDALGNRIGDRGASA